MGSAAARAYGEDLAVSRLIGLSFVVALIVLLLGAARPVAAAGDPVLLVHGYRGSPASFETMIGRFQAAGRTAVAIDLTSEDNVVNARAIRDFIAAQGWRTADIVGVSMGGLSSRYYVKELKGTGVIDAYVSLGTPQYGIWSACALPSWYGGQMCPSSGFLSNLNRRDDTKGNVFYTTIFSTNDGVVPVSASRLDGGACFVQVSGVAHNDLDDDEAVFAHVLAATDETCTGTFTTL